MEVVPSPSTKIQSNNETEQEQCEAFEPDDDSSCAIEIINRNRPTKSPGGLITSSELPSENQKSLKIPDEKQNNSEHRNSTNSDKDSLRKDKESRKNRSTNIEPTSNQVRRSLRKNNFQKETVLDARTTGGDKKVKKGTASKIKTTQIKCEDCQQVFLNSYRLTQHQEQKPSRDGFLRCENCAQTFKRSACLKYHRRQSHPELLSNSSKPHLTSDSQLHKCDLCQKTYSSKRVLDAHILRHTGVKPFECKICSASYTGFRGLRDHHYSAHSGLRQFLCEICGSSFATKGILNDHNKWKHTPDSKRFECDFCQKKCVTKSDLNCHRRTHTGEKPHACHLCPERFTAKYRLTVHLYRHHPDEMPEEDTEDVL